MSELRFTPTAARNLSLSAAVHRTPGSHAYLACQEMLRSSTSSRFGLRKQRTRPDTSLLIDPI